MYLADVAATRLESVGAVAAAVILSWWALSDNGSDESPDVGIPAGSEIMLGIRRPGAAPETAFVPDGAVFGRGRDCALVFDDADVSKAHSRISFDGRRTMIEDLNSTNGTLVNGRRIEGAVPLSRGDRIGLGANQIIFEGIHTIRTDE